MHTLMVDVAMTRRKLFLFVLDDTETLLWSGQRLGDAIDWLMDQGHTTVILDAGHEKRKLTIEPIDG